MKDTAAKEVLLFLPSFESGGAERFVVNICEEIDRDLFDPVIVSICSRSSIFDKELDTLCVKRVTLVPKSTQNYLSRYASGYREFAAYLKKNKGRFCAAHFNVAHGEDLVFAWVARRMGIPIRIVHSHNSSVNSFIKKIGHCIAKKLFEGSATDRCACSDSAAEWLFSNHVVSCGKYTVVKNGIQTRRYQFDREVREHTRSSLGVIEKKVVLHIGRLSYQKNQGFLLETFSRFVMHHNDAVLIIVGGGELRQELQEKARKLAIEDNVMWLSNRDDIPDLLFAADIFVLPSRFEGMPFSIVEAQASGLPCVVSDHISDECELTDLVQRVPLDIERFSDAMEKAFFRECYDRSVYAKKIEKCGYDLDSIARFFEEMYRKGL